MIGRIVKGYGVGSHAGDTATVIEWAPYGAGLCDALLRYSDGREVWHASASLQPADDRGPLPSRRAACETRDAQTLAQLREQREAHVRDFAKPWPGCEHGKAIVGRALDGAIDAVTARLARAADAFDRYFDGAVKCPECGSEGPHEDNGQIGIHRAFSCAACGCCFDLSRDC